MKIRRIVGPIFCLMVVAFGIYYLCCLIPSFVMPRVPHEEKASTNEKYFCPMHPSVVSDAPDKCPICGMNLEPMMKNETVEHTAAKKEGERKILFYRHPMGKDVTSPVPMKDEMGMDYIAVYQDETSNEDTSNSVEGRVPFSISRDIQQMIGVVKEPVRREHLINEIRATGRVAYDPELYNAIEEYRIATKTASITKGINSRYLQEDSNSLTNASKTRLSLLGLSDAQIQDLAKETSNPKDLVLPKGKVWVYAEVFESDLSLLKVGQAVEVTVPSFPEMKFEGQVASVSPVIDPVSRTLRIRTEISDPSRSLKPDMYARVILKVDLGEHLTVPDSAVIHTGSKNVAFVVDPKTGLFEPREIALGTRSNDRYAVNDGLSDGEIIVTSANFLVDSESRLRGVVQKARKKVETVHSHQ